MTLFVHKAIRNFRLANKMLQKELAKKMGIDERLLSNFEVGKTYPAIRYITRLNEMGAEIHPSIFSPFLQKIIAMMRTRMVILRRTDKSYLEGDQISKKERMWIQGKMLIKGLYHRDIADKAKLTRSTVSSAMSGKIKSQRVQLAIAEVLGYKTFKELREAYCQEKANASSGKGVQA